MLDLKDLTAGSTRAMIRMVGRFGIRARTPVISFWYPLLNMVRRRDPTLGTSIIAKGREPPAPDAIEPGHGAQVHPRLMTDEWVAAMNDARIAFTSRIDDTIAAWNRGISVGTNGIVSDDPRAYLRACRRGELPGAAG